MLKAYHKAEGTLTVYGTERRLKSASIDGVIHETFFFVNIVGEWEWINANEFEPAGDDE